MQDLTPAEAHERGEARADRAQKREGDAQHQESPEPAHHRHRRKQQHEKADGRRHPGGEDGGPARGGRAHRGLARVAAAALERLVEAGLELDRVIDCKPDQHRQDRDRGHREAAAGERERPEGHAGGGERQGERQQPQA
jgi:hypothetical protein